MHWLCGNEEAVSSEIVYTTSAKLSRFFCGDTNIREKSSKGEHTFRNS